MGRLLAQTVPLALGAALPLNVTTIALCIPAMKIVANSDAADADKATS